MRLIRRQPEPPDPELVKRMQFLGYLMMVWIRMHFLRFEISAERKADNS